jgi:hypothetical protein
MNTGVFYYEWGCCFNLHLHYEWGWMYFFFFKLLFQISCYSFPYWVVRALYVLNKLDSGPQYVLQISPPPIFICLIFVYVVFCQEDFFLKYISLLFSELVLLEMSYHCKIIFNLPKALSTLMVSFFIFIFFIYWNFCLNSK